MGALFCLPVHIPVDYHGEHVVFRSVIPLPPVFRKNRVAFYRQVRGIPQQELARLTGVTRATISNWERDEVVPHKRLAHKVADALQISVRKLWPYEPFF